jgi:GH18 family chitinase
MNILSYDYHSAFEPAVNHHSPLYPLEEESEYNFDAQLSIVSIETTECDLRSRYYAA